MKQSYCYMNFLANLYISSWSKWNLYSITYFFFNHSILFIQYIKFFEYNSINISIWYFCLIFQFHVLIWCKLYYKYAKDKWWDEWERKIVLDSKKMMLKWKLFKLIIQVYEWLCFINWISIKLSRIMRYQFF